MTTDKRPVSSRFAGLWPPGTPGVGAGGGTQQTTRIHPAPDRNGKRPPAQVVKPKSPPKRKKPRKSTPGGQQMPKRSKTRQGK